MYQYVHGQFSAFYSRQWQVLGFAVLSLLASPVVAGTVEHHTLPDALAYVAGNLPSGISQDKPLAFSALIEELTPNRVVFVGEVHDRYDHHLHQLALLQALHQRNPNIAIGVEWFQQPFQPVLNDFLAGNISEAEMLQRSEYFDRWRYDYRLLRPIMEYAKANRLPVIALNAPVELTRKVSGGGLEALSPGERAQLPPEINPPDHGYKARLQQIFTQHSKDASQFDNFLLVQRIWDETMAHNVVRYLKAHPQHQMLVFSGSGHISFNAGIPHDVQQQMPGIRLATVVSTDPQDIQSGMVDYFLLTRMLELPRTGKLGVLLKSAEAGGVQIGTLQEKSAAKRAGLRAGDRITRLNDVAIGSMADLMQGLSRHKPGEQVSVLVERVGMQEPLKYDVTLQ